jgi:hypothetical protein
MSRAGEGRLSLSRPGVARLRAVLLAGAAALALGQASAQEAAEPEALATTGLRGAVQPGAAPPAPRRPPPAGYVLEPPEGAPARTRRALQGNVRRDPARPVRTPVQRPVAVERSEPLPPRARRRAPEEDPYAPLGVRAGGFVLRPAVEAGVGWTDNATSTAGGQTASGFSRTAAEIRAESNWSAHQLGLRGRIERQDFFTDGIDPRLTVDLASQLRLDVTRDTRVDLGAAYRRAPDSATTFSLPVTATGRPDLETTTMTAGVTQRFNRLQLGVRGQFDQLRYGETRLSDGSELSNATRNVDVTTVTLRAGYELSPALIPFVEVARNRRDYQIGIDLSGLTQGSEGEVVRAGAAFDFGPTLRGEASFGALRQRYDDPRIGEVTGPTFDAQLAWAPTALTTVRLLARTSVLDSTGIGAAGGISRDFTLAVDHLLQRNLLLTASVGYGFDDFNGIARLDERTTYGLAATYRLNRTVSLRLSGSHQRTRSNVAGNDYDVTTVEAGVRVEY